MNGGTRERELLLCSARVSMDALSAERFRTLCRQDLDWDYILRLTEAHGMIPLVYRYMRALAAEAAPKAVIDQLRQRYHANALRNLSLAGEMIQLLELFQTHGITAIPFKGPTLAALAYGDLALRQFNDLDFLVNSRDIL